MVIIDQNTEAVLLKDIQEHQKSRHDKRCLCLKLSRLMSAPDNMLPDLIKAAKDFFSEEDGYIYVCENRDLLIMPARAFRKDIARFFAKSCTPLLPDPLPEGVVVLYETEVNWHELIMLCKKKVQIIKDRENAIEQEKLKAAEEKKREKILNMRINDNHIASIPERRAQRKTPSVLLVEDDPFTQKLIHNTIRKAVEVTVAQSGYEAINFYADKAPDLLFLDIGLPDVTGHDILQKILGMDPSAYIVMLSGNGDRDNVLKAIELGAKGFIGKPFTKDKLFQYIEKSPHILDKKQ